MVGDPDAGAVGPERRVAGRPPGTPVPDADAIAFQLELPQLVLRQVADAYAHARGRAARDRACA